MVKSKHRQLLYVICALLWLSGVLWLYFWYAAQRNAEFGPQTYPVQSVCLKFHGALAMGFLIIFGRILSHIYPGWRRKYQRPSGISLLVLCGILIVSGWGLYYIGHEQVRSITSTVHSVLGLLLPVIIVLHVWKFVQRRSKKKRLASRKS